MALTADRVRAFLRDARDGQATLTDLAEAAGCSRFAAYRAFRVRFGLSPSEYQRQLRLRTARLALAGGTAVADAAAAAGFADQAHLTRWFRRCYGITPGAYRTACAGGDRDDDLHLRGTAGRPARATPDPPGTQVISCLLSCLPRLGRPCTTPLRPV